MKEQEQYMIDNQRIRMSIIRDKRKTERKVGECIIEKIRIWVSNVTAKVKANVKQR